MAAMGARTIEYLHFAQRRHDQQTYKASSTVAAVGGRGGKESSRGHEADERARRRKDLPRRERPDADDDGKHLTAEDVDPLGEERGEVVRRRDRAVGEREAERERRQPMRGRGEVTAARAARAARRGRTNVRGRVCEGEGAPGERLCEGEEGEGEGSEREGARGRRRTWR